MSATEPIPTYARELMDRYCAPRQDGWEVAVFYEQVAPGCDLRSVAQRHYHKWVGMSEATWRDSALSQLWGPIYQRTPELEPRSITSELLAALQLTGLPYDHQMINQMLDLHWPDGYATAQTVLKAAFDAPEVETFQVYCVGDGAAQVGFLALGSRANGETVILVGLHGGDAIA